MKRHDISQPRRVTLGRIARAWHRRYGESRDALLRGGAGRLLPLKAGAD
ncbi:hypothetical protein [Sphingomonas xanthus]|nr:hypothetical protein [Sphingomonas xanthus]